MLRKSFLALSLATLMLPVFAQANYPAVPAENQRTITVEGVAFKEVVPNKARISFGLIGEGKTAQEAKNRHDMLMTRVAQALEALGIPKAKISTDSFSITPLYTRPKDGSISVIAGYRVSNILALETNDMEMLTQALETAVDAGANTVYSIDFSYDKPAALQDKLIVAAVENGMHNAQLVARATGARLGKLVSANVYDNDGTRLYGMRAMAVESKNMDASTPIYSGTQKVSMRINLVFEVI